MANHEVEILLVEDSMQDAKMTIRALQKSNLLNNLIHLRDGADAIDFLFGRGEYSERNTNIKPRLILLDLKMPRMDGIEVLEIIKGDSLTRKIPVVMLTSSREGPDIEKCYELGVNSYIVKPVEFDDFMKAITDLGFYWMLLNQHAEQQ